MTPSLPNQRMLPVRQDLCVTCIAAATKVKVKRDVTHPPHKTTTTTTAAAVNDAISTGAAAATTTSTVCHIDYDEDDDSEPTPGVVHRATQWTLARITAVWWRIHEMLDSFRVCEGTLLNKKISHTHANAQNIPYCIFVSLDCHAPLQLTLDKEKGTSL